MASSLRQLDLLELTFRDRHLADASLGNTHGAVGSHLMRRVLPLSPARFISSPWQPHLGDLALDWTVFPTSPSGFEYRASTVMEVSWVNGLPTLNRRHTGEAVAAINRIRMTLLSPS
jgi:hypothetical protein